MADRTLGVWANDTSLFHRLRDSVLELARGKGKFQDRANYAVERLRSIREADFPEDLRPTFRIVRELSDESVWHGPVVPLLRTGMLRPRQRRALVDAIFNLYEAMVVARARS
jgi:hypothetical protein